MTEYIEIGGEKRPFSVGIGALIEFEKKTGKNFLAMSDGEEVNLSLSDLGTLAYCCLHVGARAQKKNFDFEQHEIIDWIDEDGAFEEINNLITEGMGKLGKGKAKQSPKRKRAPKSTPR